MKVSSVKVFGLVALGTVVGFVDGCGSGAAELSGDFPAVGGQQLVSMAYDSYTPCNAFSKEPDLSFDGRFVAYASKGSNVIENDQTSGTSRNDVYRFDRLIQQNVIVDVRADGVQANVEEVSQCAHRAGISDDGKLVVFQAAADNLVSGTGPYGVELVDQNGECDIFVKNLVTGALECVTLPAAISGSSEGASWPRISGNGRFVSFTSCYDFTGMGLLQAAEGYGSVWVYDRVAKTYEVASLDLNGIPVSVSEDLEEDSTKSDISADGRYVVYQTQADIDTVLDQNGGDGDVYRFDRVTRRTELVALAADGQGGGLPYSAFNDGPFSYDWYDCGGSSEGAISADGRFVAFKSRAVNLIPGDDQNGYAKVYVRDMNSNSIVCCSLGVGGVQPIYDQDGDGIDDYIDEVGDFSGNGNEANSQRPRISADGRYIVFDSLATNLVAGDTNDSRDVFVYDRLTGQTRRVANPPYEIDGENAYYVCQHHPAISGDGRFVSYMRGGNNSAHYPMIMVAPNPFLGGSGDESTPIPSPETIES